MPSRIQKYFFPLIVFALLSNVSLWAQSPTIITNLLNRVAIARTPTTLSVNVSGLEPLSYQWRSNDVLIVGATNSSLLFNSVQPGDAGRYTVTISNSLGAVTSRMATLTVKDYPYPSTVVAWGDNSFGQTNRPSGETNIIALSAGALQTVFLRGDGTLGDVGNQIVHPNTYGRLPSAASIGNVNHYGLMLGKDGTPVAFGLTYLSGSSDVPLSVTNIVATTIGTPRLALKDDGTVVGWLGVYNGPPDPNGILAYLTTLSNVADVAMRDLSDRTGHCLALKSNGTVVVFGYNIGGVFNVPPGLNNVSAIAAGAAHNLALRTNGVVVAWGNNDFGQTNVPVGLSNVVAICAGDYHSLALKSNGVVVAWGDNTYGQRDVPSSLSNVVYISAGSRHSSALTKQPGESVAPVSSSIFAGGNVNFTFIATGYAPLYYQWQFNGTNILGETNNFLSLTNTPLPSAGSYQCLVSNAFGSASSSPATLSVSRQSPQFDGAEFESANGFRVLLKQLSGHGPIVIEASSDLLDWSRIYTNEPILGTLEYLDAEATNKGTRFYRAFEQ